MTCSLLKAFVSCEHASNWTLLLEENRNHVWSDLSRLVDVECKNGP